MQHLVFSSAAFIYFSNSMCSSSCWVFFFPLSCCDEHLSNRDVFNLWSQEGGKRELPNAGTTSAAGMICLQLLLKALAPSTCPYFLAMLEGCHTLNCPWHECQPVGTDVKTIQVQVSSFQDFYCCFLMESLKRWACVWGTWVPTRAMCSSCIWRGMKEEIERCVNLSFLPFDLKAIVCCWNGVVQVLHTPCPVGVPYLERYLLRWAFDNRV